MKYSYRNPWHNPKNPSAHSPAMFETDVEPKEYQGVQIFFRSDRADYVKDGVAISQRNTKSMKGAKEWIDSVLAGKDLLVAPDFTRRPL